MNHDRLGALWPDVRTPLDKFGSDGVLAERFVVSLSALRALLQLRADPEKYIIPDQLADECGRGPANLRRDLDQLVRYGVLRRDRQLGYAFSGDPAVTTEIDQLFTRLEGDPEFRMATSSVALQRELLAVIDELETRKVTQLAKRVLMQTRGVSEEEAHSFLLKRSRDRNLPLRDLAELIINNGNAAGPTVVAMRPRPVQPFRSASTQHMVSVEPKSAVDPH